jgi:sarcosine oxidase gamma subunit
MKRPGLTGLLLAVSALSACGPAPAPGGGKSKASSFAVRYLTAERTGDHLHLTIAAQVKNPGAAALTLTPPAVQLFAETKAVPPFLAPGLEPAVIPPGGEAEAVTHWWLAAADLSGALTLEISGARAEVKSTAAFALDLLPEQSPVLLSFPDWKTP